MTETIERDLPWMLENNNAGSPYGNEMFKLAAARIRELEAGAPVVQGAGTFQREVVVGAIREADAVWNGAHHDRRPRYEAIFEAIKSFISIAP